jgi:hypothetical protein
VNDPKTGVDPVNEHDPKCAADPNPEADSQDIHIPFSDRLIAFVILLGPFCLFADKAQALTLQYASQYVNNIVILLSIVLFLFAVGRLSHVVYGYRTKRSRTDA